MKEIIEKAWEDRSMLSNPEVQNTINAVIEELDKGRLRVAQPNEDGSWTVND